MEPDLAAVHYNKALELEKKGRYVDAVDEYREAVRLEPADADAFIRLGLLLRELGRDDEANKAFQSALAVNAVRGGGWGRLGSRWVPARPELP